MTKPNINQAQAETAGLPPRMMSPWLIYGALVLGLVTAICFRVIIILNHLQPTWVRPVWYIGVLGNFVFFYYRFKVTQKRKKTVERFQLIEKLGQGKPLSEADRQAVVYLLSSIKVSPENINYFIIFIFSLIAMAVDISLTIISMGS